nr:hypothetical protein [Lentzea flava]
MRAVCRDSALSRAINASVRALAATTASTPATSAQTTAAAVTVRSFLVRRTAAASARLACATLSSTNARSTRLSRTGAAAETAYEHIDPSRVPVASAAGSRALSAQQRAASVIVRCTRSASRCSSSQERILGQAVSTEPCAISAVSRSTTTSRAAARWLITWSAPAPRSSSSPRSTRRRVTAPVSSSADTSRRISSAASCRAEGSSSPQAFSAVCATAQPMPPAAVKPASVSTSPRRRRHVSSRACDSNGSAPARPSASFTTVTSRARSTDSPTASAGLVTAAVSSSVSIGPISTWLSRTASAKPGCSANRPVKSARTHTRRRNRRSGARIAARNSSRSPSSQRVYSSSN